MPRSFSMFVVLAWLGAPAVVAEEAVQRGEIEFRVTKDEPEVPQRFQLEDHEFPYERREMETASKQMQIWEVTFPSPVTTPHVKNNTVHCEYFHPTKPGSYPGVIVLHILGGDFDLSRLFARTLAHHGVCALFVKMPYYGPRRQAGVEARMVSLDPKQTVRGMTQAVLDIRRATAWLGAQREVDEERLGVFGISLGGITGALAAAGEPRLKNVCLVLAGGDIGKVAWQSPQVAKYRKRWIEQGGTLESLQGAVRPVDPVTYGRHVRGRRIFMLNAKHDELIPKECTLSLWESLGQPEIRWFDGGHYSAMRFLFDTLTSVTRFFQQE